ncbi:hypothetical protein VaNZ11_012356 [Volvox africanus]|uniref:DUF4460 domain-containing protein n=1 Tax=Volvox africanus TaxID=51714 RepID=A0ABQ5SF05_9CHLO|nr:hypothetical protein VaNZ11_012356 [Volvox africanus]
MNPTVSYIQRSTKTYIEIIALELSERLLACDCSSFHDIWTGTSADSSTAAADAEVAAANHTCIQSQYLHCNGDTNTSTSNNESINNRGGNSRSSGGSGNNCAIYTTTCKGNQSDQGANRGSHWQRRCLASTFDAHDLRFSAAATPLVDATAALSPASSCQPEGARWRTQNGRAAPYRHRHSYASQCPAEHQLLVDAVCGEGKRTGRNIQGTTWQPCGSGAATTAAARFTVRGFASSAGEGAGGVGRAAGDGSGGEANYALPLRAALRLLYKRVHPDLFHDLPRAKAENERSFKLLQEYVQLAKGGDLRSPAARLPYRFAFYLREAPQGVEAGELERPEVPATPPLRPYVGARAKQQQQQRVPVRAAARDREASSGGNPSCDDSEEVAGLHLVRVTLPPPAISAPGAKDLAAPTRRALIKLLAACGLASTGKEGTDDADDTVAAEDGGPLSLAAFLPDAVEAMRQAEAARASDSAVRVANLRGALRMHRQVMVSFSDKQLPAVAQVALLERLARVVDTAGPELQLQGCHIVLGDRLGLDRMGHLCLSTAEPNDAWTDFLRGVDMDFVLQQRKNVQVLRNMEAQVARAVGVAQIFTPYSNLMEPSYRGFLERLASAATTRGPLGDGAFGDVSLCGMPPLPSEPGQPCTPSCRLDGITPGVIQVATDTPDAYIYEAVAKLGTDAQAAVRMHRHVESQLVELSSKTRQRLRMRSFTRDPRVAPDHFRRACILLLEQTAALMPLLEGSSVRIGFANRIAPDGSCIEIAHDFML